MPAEGVSAMHHAVIVDDDRIAHLKPHRDFDSLHRIVQRMDVLIKGADVIETEAVERRAVGLGAGIV